MNAKNIRRRTLHVFFFLFLSRRAKTCVSCTWRAFTCADYRLSNFWFDMDIISSLRTRICVYISAVSVLRTSTPSLDHKRSYYNRKLPLQFSSTGRYSRKKKVTSVEVEAIRELNRSVAHSSQGVTSSAYALVTAAKQQVSLMRCVCLSSDRLIRQYDTDRLAGSWVVPVGRRKYANLRPGTAAGDSWNHELRCFALWTVRSSWNRCWGILLVTAVHRLETRPGNKVTVSFCPYSTYS